MKINALGKVLIVAVAFIFLLTVLAILGSLSSKENSKPEPISTPAPVVTEETYVRKTADDDYTSPAAQIVYAKKYQELYNEILGFKDDPFFHEMIFATAGKWNDFPGRTHELSQNNLYEETDTELYAFYLLDIATEYGRNKGQLVKPLTIEKEKIIKSKLNELLK